MFCHQVARGRKAGLFKSLKKGCCVSYKLVLSRGFASMHDTACDSSKNGSHVSLHAAGQGNNNNLHLESVDAGPHTAALGTSRVVYSYVGWLGSMLVLLCTS